MATINGASIPTPSAVEAPSISQKWRGSGREKASGIVRFQWVQASRKRTWKLSWTAINATALGQLQTAYDALAAATDSGIAYVDVSSTSYQVTLDPGSFELDTQQVLTGSGVRYNVNLTLRQV
jgi:hypothetical protein